MIEQVDNLALKPHEVSPVSIQARKNFLVAEQIIANRTLTEPGYSILTSLRETPTPEGYRDHPLVDSTKMIWQVALEGGYAVQMSSLDRLATTNVTGCVPVVFNFVEQRKIRKILAHSSPIVTPFDRKAKPFESPIPMIMEHVLQHHKVSKVKIITNQTPDGQTSKAAHIIEKYLQAELPGVSISRIMVPMEKPYDIQIVDEEISAWPTDREVGGIIVQ